jgi:large subunit ribosomal protein L17
MFRNMVTSLFKYERIKTTDAKAKELRRWADHIVTLAKRGDLHARRMAMSILREKDVVHKVFQEAPGRFGSINGGYTRIVKIGRRAGDAAAMTLIELVSSNEVKATKKKKLKPATKTAAPSITPGPASDSDSDRQSKEKAKDAEATAETDEQDEPAIQVKKIAEVEEAAVGEDEESAGASAKEVGDQPAPEK